MTHMSTSKLSALACGVLLSACVTTTDGRPEREVSSSPWLEPSPVLAQQIEDQAKRLPWTHGVERVELIAWFARVGEPAYPKLLELAADPSIDVAGSALAALGATGDKRLVRPLHEVAWQEPLSPVLELERARTLTRLGDWSEIDALIRGLRSEDTMTRSLCIQALGEATGDKLGYDARASELEREAAAKQWDAWLARRRGEGILASR